MGRLAGWRGFDLWAVALCVSGQGEEGRMAGQPVFRKGQLAGADVTKAIAGVSENEWI